MRKGKLRDGGEGPAGDVEGERGWGIGQEDIEMGLGGSWKVI